MSELFDATESLSPRVKWIRKHKIKTSRKDPDLPLDAWVCWSGELYNIIGSHEIGVGETEGQAMADWAKRHGVKLWN